MYSFQAKNVEEKDILKKTLARVRTVAQRMLVDHRQYVGTGLRHFEGSAMSKAEFREALRSQFNLKLSKEEVSCL